MALVQQITGDINVVGKVTCQDITIPSGKVTDASVTALAGIAASKLQHAHRVMYAQPGGTSATTETKAVYVVVGLTGSIQAVKLGASTAATGGAKITLDVHKNGSTILSATQDLASSTSAYTLISVTPSSTALAAGDVLEVLITTTPATGGNLPQGVFVAIDIFEAAQ